MPMRLFTGFQVNPILTLITMTYMKDTVKVMGNSFPGTREESGYPTLRFLIESRPLTYSLILQDKIGDCSRKSGAELVKSNIFGSLWKQPFLVDRVETFVAPNNQ